MLTNIGECCAQVLYQAEVKDMQLMQQANRPSGLQGGVPLGAAGMGPLGLQGGGLLGRRQANITHRLRPMQNFGQGAPYSAQVRASHLAYASSEAPCAYRNQQAWGYARA